MEGLLASRILVLDCSEADKKMLELTDAGAVVIPLGQGLVDGIFVAQTEMAFQVTQKSSTVPIPA